MSKNFAETDRLALRQLEIRDFPRLSALMSDWQVAQWLVTQPYPFTKQDAESLFAKVSVNYVAKNPGYFAIASKTDNNLIGAVVLYPPHNPCANRDESAIGYWLGTPYQGNGYMREAVGEAIKFGFSCSRINTILATTQPANAASEKILHETGFQHLGQFTRTEKVLRGGNIVNRWSLTRANYRHTP